MAKPALATTALATTALFAILTFERIGNDLILKISGSSEKIISEDFFASWGAKNLGIDQIRFADGSLMDREAIHSHTTTVGDGRDNLVQDTALKDVLQGGKGHDEIRIGGGNDTILYAAGDGFDVINDTSGCLNSNALEGEKARMHRIVNLAARIAASVPTRRHSHAV
jgi:Ca2+-binding RTX toxin-like protein